MSQNESYYSTFIPGELTPCFHFEGPQIQATERVLDSLAAMTERHVHLPAFGRWAREMAAHLRSLWTAEPFVLPLYPAFR